MDARRDPFRLLSAAIPPIAFLGMVAVAIFAVWWGPLNQDEGWYLYAARLFREGLRPWRDFFFTQGPALPAVYSLILPPGSGLLAGRIATALLGWLALGETLLLLRGRGIHLRGAFLLTSLLMGCNLYHAYFTTIPKTYALASALLMGGFLALQRSTARPLLAALSGLLLAAAAATRLSLGAALPAVGATLLWQAVRPAPTANRPRARLLFFVAGGLLGLAILVACAAAWNPEVFLEAQRFHAARQGSSLILVCGSLLRLLGAYLPLVLLALALRRFRWSVELAAFLAIGLVQLSAPFPYDDYQVPAMPLLLVALATSLEFPAEPARRIRAELALLILCGICAATSPLVQASLLYGQDRFWPQIKRQSDLQVLRETAREVRRLVPPGEPLLTQDLYLAVEADRPVPKGFEMGPFGYFPEASDDYVRRNHLHNRRTLEALLSTTSAPAAALSGYTFAIAAPAMTPIPECVRRRSLDALRARYSPVAEIPRFGQHHTTLQILRRNP
ncbi:MAG: hypothetical protein ACI4QD_00540 [Kiritimatiellia bacterium]